MRLCDFSTLSFDCYGTLIDWERGLLSALRPWLEKNKVSASEDEVLEAFADCEHEAQAKTPKAPYPVILAHVHAMLGEHFRIPSAMAERDSFGATIGDWPPFPDTAEALQYLKRHFKLIILSNVDNASFSKSERAIGVKFDAVYTAEMIGTYKPSLNNFRYLIDRMRADFGVVPAEHLHVAQSLFHDHIPAKGMGLNTCWIDRRAGKEGGGATKIPAAGIKYDFRFETLQALADAHRREQA